MSSHYEQSSCPSSTPTSVSESGRALGRALQPVRTQRRGHFLLLHVCTPLVRSWTNMCYIYWLFSCLTPSVEGMAPVTLITSKSLTIDHGGSLTHTITRWKSPEKLSFSWWWWLHSAEMLNEPCEVVFSAIIHLFQMAAKAIITYLFQKKKKSCSVVLCHCPPPPPLFPGISDVISLYRLISMLELYQETDFVEWTRGQPPPLLRRSWTLAVTDGAKSKKAGGNPFRDVCPLE